MPELHYEPTAEGRPVAVEHDGEITRIVVAMPGVYAPVPAWVWELDLFSVVIGPVCTFASLIARTLLRLPKPPRAVFEITGAAAATSASRRTAPTRAAVARRQVILGGFGTGLSYTFKGGRAGTAAIAWHRQRRAI